MAIKVKVEKKNIEKIINKGGNVCEDNQNDKWTVITLRIPQSFIKKLDEQRSKHIGMSRTAWLLQMIQRNIESQ